MEGHVSELLVQFWDDLAHRLGSTSGCKNDVLTNPITFLMGHICSSGGSDDVYCGHESFYSDKVFPGNVGQGDKQLVVQEVLPTILSELSHFSWFTLIEHHYCDLAVGPLTSDVSSVVTSPSSSG